MSWTIVLVQMDCVAGDTEANLIRIAARAAEAAERGAQLVLFPECATTGYFVADRIESLAESVPGPSSERLARLAHGTGVHLMVGMIERAEGKYFDDAILFTPDGDQHVYGLAQPRRLDGRVSDRTGFGGAGRGRGRRHRDDRHCERRFCPPPMSGTAGPNFMKGKSHVLHLDPASAEQTVRETFWIGATHSANSPKSNTSR